MTDPEVLEFGTRSGPPRRLVIAVIAALVLALAVAATLQLRDRRQTLDQAQLEAVLRGFRTEGTTRVITEGDFAHGLSTDPDRCEDLLDPGADGVQGGATWSEPDGAEDAVQLDALRYPDPRAARAAMAAVRTAAAACATFRIEPRDVADEGAEVLITAPARHWWSDRAEQRFALRAPDPNGFGFAVVVRRFGNVVVWGYSTTERAESGRAAAGDLVDRLREVVRP